MERPRHSNPILNSADVRFALSYVKKRGAKKSKSLKNQTLRILKRLQKLKKNPKKWGMDVINFIFQFKSYQIRN